MGVAGVQAMSSRWNHRLGWPIATNALLLVYYFVVVDRRAFGELCRLHAVRRVVEQGTFAAVATVIACVVLGNHGHPVYAEGAVELFVAAAVEEVIFRVLLIHRMATAHRRSDGHTMGHLWIPVAASGFTFALAHVVGRVEWPPVPPAAMGAVLLRYTTLGLLYSEVRQSCGVSVGIALHAVGNIMLLSATDIRTAPPSLAGMALLGAVLLTMHVGRTGARVAGN
jgi:membrane protease YdiL (CAAX protease family)